jgi:hypothetical protein
MRVFISWSGEDSQKAAELIKAWLPNVIQEVDPWVSTHDIPKGQKWQASLSASLADTTFGLLMVTKTNFREPWLVFEAGALSNLEGSHVIPLLCSVGQLDIASTPLAQFQAVVVDKNGVKDVVTEIARKCSKQLGETQLAATFEKWWPDFESGYRSISFAAETGREENEKSSLVKIENGLEDIMKYLRRIEQSIQSSLIIVDENSATGGSGEGQTGIMFPVGTRPGGLYTPSDTATKLAKALLEQPRRAGLGMVKPEQSRQAGLGMVEPD